MVATQTCFDIGLVDDLLQSGCEILDDENRLGAGILQLVLQFTRRIKRVDVHDDEARLQNGGSDNGKLQNVGQHDGNTVTFLQSA